jgi:Ni,Fe-hydrogenase III large subunit
MFYLKDKVVIRFGSHVGKTGEVIRKETRIRPDGDVFIKYRVRLDTEDGKRASVEMIDKYLELTEGKGDDSLLEWLGR